MTILLQAINRNIAILLDSDFKSLAPPVEFGKKHRETSLRQAKNSRFEHQTAKKVAASHPD
jgi:hypothetical protein